MRINEYEKIISKLENREFVFVDRTAGLQNINLIKELSEREIIELIMERE
jgi:adenine/guanine phosphoribosyltransferase-like PRPP-binding protein